MLHQRLDPRRILKLVPDAAGVLAVVGLHQRLDPRRILKRHVLMNIREMSDGLHQRLDPRRILKPDYYRREQTVDPRYTRGSIRGGY